MASKLENLWQSYASKSNTQQTPLFTNNGLVVEVFNYLAKELYVYDEENTLVASNIYTSAEELGTSRMNASPSNLKFPIKRACVYHMKLIRFNDINQVVYFYASFYGADYIGTLSSNFAPNPINIQELNTRNKSYVIAYNEHYEHNESPSLTHNALDEIVLEGIEAIKIVGYYNGDPFYEYEVAPYPSSNIPKKEIDTHGNYLILRHIMKYQGKGNYRFEITKINNETFEFIKDIESEKFNFYS